MILAVAAGFVRAKFLPSAGVEVLGYNLPPQTEDEIDSPSPRNHTQQSTSLRGVPPLAGRQSNLSAFC